MKSPTLFVVVLAAGLVLGLSTTALAQRPNEGTAPPPNTGGGGAPAGGNGGGMGSSWAGGSNSGGGSAGVASPVGGSNTGGSWSGGGAGSPTWGGSNSTVRPRDGGPRLPGTADQAAGRNRNYTAGSDQVPWYSRPRGPEIPTTGTAITRTDWINSRPPGSGGGGGPDYPGYPGYPGGYPGYGWGSAWYMYPWAYGSYGYGYGYPGCFYGGFGPGYFFYNPFSWNYYGGCGSYGYGYGYGSYDAWYGGGGGSVGVSGGYQPSGGIRFKVKPASARVYVDGYFAGTVDAFDGRFQRLAIEHGKHKIEISADGYTPLMFEVDIKDSETMTWEGNLEKKIK